MLSKIKSASLVGITAIEITVEVDCHPGIPTEIIVGLPDMVIKESKSRIKSAIKHSALKYPHHVFTINLAPAEIKKEGPSFDLPIALGILNATKQVKVPSDVLFVGELSLNGDLRPVRGIVSIADMAAKQGISSLFVPQENAAEAALIPGLEIIPVTSLLEVIAILEGEKPRLAVQSTPILKNVSGPDFLDVKGQLSAKRALEVAAAGNHNVLFVGPPGSGKTMLLKRLPSILPDLTHDQAIESYKIRSVAQRVSRPTLSLERPFRNPHYSISYAGLIGGGSNPMPGEISLAHHGVLFLDELPEFQRQVIEVLRQPLEEKTVTISRANAAVTYPANVLFAAAMNPCPCGYHRDSAQRCLCRPEQIQKYWKKLSGPILDRIDIILEVPRLKKDDYFSVNPDSDPFASHAIKTRVETARTLQYSRYQANRSNADMTPKDIRQFCELTTENKALLENAIDKGLLSGRSFDRVLKLARTIADLAGASNIEKNHLLEALQYRKRSQQDG
ncbi:MAG: YifB family Mg chelatase-like AAA ATPase [Candidatus Margulisiibacteriota bacterium]